MYLGPHHFQAQSRYFEGAIQFVADTLWYRPWGFLGLELNQEALRNDALNQLTFTTKRAAVNIKKALSAAIADAEQAEADVTALFVAESRVDGAGMMKRFQPKDRGRAHPIEKRFSNITVAVEERAAKAS
jgi:ribosomal protein L22